MNAIPNGPIAEPSVVGLSLVGLIVIGALAAIVLLISHRKTRLATLVVFGGAAVAAMLVRGYLATSHVSQPAVILTRPVANGASRDLMQMYESVQEVAPVPPSPTVKPATPAPVDAATKREEELAQAVATKAVGFLRAITRALGRALAEEEKILTEKKEEAKLLKLLPSPAGRGAGGEGSAAKKDEVKPVSSHAGKEAGSKGSAGDKPALTLTLSQRERGPIAKTRPAWVDAAPHSVGHAFQISASVGPYTTRAECDAKVPEVLQDALDRYVETCLGDQAHRDVRLPTDFLRERLVKAEWEETRQLSVGPMTWLHLLLQFDGRVRDRVLEEHRQWIVNERLGVVGTWSGIGLGLLTTVFGYLKIDLATGGRYRGRLRLVAATVILVALIVVVAATV